MFDLGMKIERGKSNKQIKIGNLCNTFETNIFPFPLILDEFYIMENDDIICYGEIRPSNDNCTMLIFDNDENEFEICLNKKDIYRDLRISNYNYGPCFQKIKTIKTNNFECIEAEIEWDGNMVSFLDCCLQTFLTNYCIRKLMIPIEIEYFSIDPKILLKEIR